MAEAIAAIQRPRRAAGRPRRITVDTVVETAAKLGIDQIEMKDLAKRLGVGVGTLYGYVEGREDLIRLVADRVSQRARIEDRGQSWQDAAREHAAATFDVYHAWPQLIPQTMAAALNKHVDVGPLNDLLAILTDRGVPPDEALSLFYEVNQVVIGAVVGRTYLRAVEESMGGYPEVIRRALADDPSTDHAALRACAAAGTPASLGDYRVTLERVLAAHAARLKAAGQSRPDKSQAGSDEPETTALGG